VVGREKVCSNMADLSVCIGDRVSRVFAFCWFCFVGSLLG
jgi:hypothetical protein